MSNKTGRLAVETSDGFVARRIKVSGKSDAAGAVCSCSLRGWLENA